MAQLRMFQVDAFTKTRFAGNPAAVVLLDTWLPDAVLTAIAAENNLAETAFLVATAQDGYELRWFTPTSEVPLCGHATLASALVLADEIGLSPPFQFHTRKSGTLQVDRSETGYSMRLPRRTVVPGGDPAEIAAVLGIPVLETRFVPVDGDDMVLAVVADEGALMAMRPDIRAIAALDARSLLVTAKGDSVDFVSRYFAPRFGIDEDSVTGSTHCALTPFWAERLGKTSLTARQLSKRGGSLTCQLDDDAVIIGGEAVLYLRGTIIVD
ncbi:PhzF family phenazine biosynthesis protein [Aureimonas altamirensis]|uniref:PhzF family phenazine biosynthesis protein n=1 Tax=Aureimonas altamirensis TaxID=370622 RepID=UPI0030178932